MTEENYLGPGAGPPYIRLSSRCVKYRCIDLYRWAEGRLRKTTSDPGGEDG